jgi:DnaA family protein
VSSGLSNFQLPLSVQIRDDASFDNYFAGANQEAVDCLTRASQGKTSDGAVFLSGPAGVGKSHLLQAACQKAEEQSIAAVYLPLDELRDESVEMLEGLESLSLICIDDLQAVAANKAWEQALFHLYNRVFETGTQIVFSADKAIANLGIQLPDLASRLAWGFVYRLHALSDEEKLQALQERAKRRGFEMPSNVGQYLLRVYPRDMQALLGLLSELDSASLAAQKSRLTVPFVKAWLEQKNSTQVALF